MIHLQIDETVPHSIQIMAFDRSCLHLVSIKQQTDGLVSSTAGFGLGEQIKRKRYDLVTLNDGVKRCLDLSLTQRYLGVTMITYWAFREGVGSCRESGLAV